MADYWLDVSTPVGILRLEATDSAITKLDVIKSPFKTPSHSNNLLKRAAKQLTEYFSGNRTKFDLPLESEGTDFQRQVWKALTRIPFGETRSYAQIAQAIGHPLAVRAVGGACHRNPLMIFVPCHRVVGANGSLTGFGGGIPMKEWLLSHEGITLS